MDHPEQDKTLESHQRLLGYLNFSEGRPDPVFQKTLAGAYAELSSRGITQPWAELYQRLRGDLARLQAAGSSAFRNAERAEKVLSLVFERVLPAYRSHHADLLFHLEDAELFQPFFVARVVEAVLGQDPLRDDQTALVQDVLRQLNDYLGHRPIAVLESRPKGEPYPKERVRPIPLFIPEAGVAPGRFHDLIVQALEILRETDENVLVDAYFDLHKLDELALDPRAYDHAHPVNRRPNYVFGEWDPHCIDTKGGYRRFIVRQLILEAIQARLTSEQELAAEELLFEAGAVLAGVMLMASGVSGSGPETHDSSVTLASLIPRIAQYRDVFYASLLKRRTGAHGERLRREAEKTRQPFGGARQHLNQFLARHRAAQLQHRHLAMLMAELGYPEASARQAAKIPAASVRLVGEIHIRLSTGQKCIEKNRLQEAARELTTMEDLLRRGIACGALPDPWNILGFGGLFPLFHAVEDSVRDQRIDELVGIMEATFSFYSRVMSEAAAAGDTALTQQLSAEMKRLAEWWDQFATYEVGDVQRVHGGESYDSAEHVARALQSWRQKGESPADLAFWRDHLKGFRSAKAFALVVDVLLRKQDYHAAMGLMMHWLSQLEEVPLEDGEYSFHPLALRWMLGVCRDRTQKISGTAGDRKERPPEIVVKFFDFLEANAEELWNVPELELLGIPLEDGEEEEEDYEEEGEELFEAAYEGVTFEDSTDDDIESEVLEVGPHSEFELEWEAERLEIHLRFLSTVARLWNIAVRLTCDRSSRDSQLDSESPLWGWFQQAKQNFQNLLLLLDSVSEHPIPQPLGSYDSLVEYDRQRVIRDQLLNMIISTCLDTWLAIGALRGRRHPPASHSGWKAMLSPLEEALWSGDAGMASELISPFLNDFKHEPLLFTPLSSGGRPRQILRATRAQTILRALAANLPRLGLLRETLQTVQFAQQVERQQPLQGPRVTEFDRLLQLACHASVEAIIDATKNSETPVADEELVSYLERLIRPYLPLWTKHSQTLRVSMLETLSDDNQWQALRNFILRYGRQLFHVRFMAMGNLRGILHQGVGKFLEYLEDRDSASNPIKLLDEIGKMLSRNDAEQHLSVILQTLIENYDIYKDYNSTAPQSDYGENLHILFDFLRLKARYERQAWLLRPLVHVHEVLARHRPTAAVIWQQQFTRATRTLADRHLDQLAELEQRHGIRLNTIRDRLEERLVQTLGLDRICALIEPMLDAAGTPEAPAMLEQFEKEIQPYADHPTGVGLDVPQWLGRLGATLHHIRMSRTTIAGLAENLLQIPKQPLALPNLEAQLAQMNSDDGPFHLWEALIDALGNDE